MLKGFLFDLCGTLLIYGDMNSAWDEWLETGYACFRKAGLKMSLEHFSMRCDGLFSQPEPARQNDGLTVYERRLKRLGEELGHSMTESELQATAMATISTWADRMSPDPDCPSVLEKLHQRQRLTIVSNFDHPPYIDMALRKFGLKPYFAEVIISSQAGFNKPDPRIFHLALTQSGLQPGEVVHVGDSLEDDIKGARAAGIRPILIQRVAGREMPATDYKALKNRILPDNSAGTEVKTIRKLTELLELD